MPTKKKSRKVQSSCATSATAQCKAQSQSGVRSFAAMEAQIAELQEQIAALQAQSQVQSSKSKAQSGEIENTNTLNSELCTLNSTGPSPLVGAPLATPVIENMTAVGSSFLRVTWNPVADAGGYVVRYSTDETFATNVNTVNVDETTATVMLNGLQANTVYYAGVKAIGTGVHLDSPFSVAKSAATGIVSGDESVTHIQDWLAEMQSVFQNFATLMPELETTVLTPLERRRLLGSGVRRYGFIDQVSDVAADNPQFWPASANLQDALKDQLRKIEAIRNLLVWLRTIERIAGDLFLLTSHEAFQMANTYYGSVRAAARSNILGAAQVFQLLQLFWRRHRRTTEEPTIPEVERDMRALLRGTKDGEIVIRNESDRVVKGERVVIDETRKATPRGGVKVVETGEVAGG